MLWIYCLLLLAAANADKRLPPSIVKQESGTKYFRSDTDVVLSCVATGIPHPNISWHFSRDSVEATMLNNAAPQEDGSLKISMANSLNEGNYHCSAENDYGRARSTAVELKRARAGRKEPQQGNLETFKVQVHQTLKLQCQGIVDAFPPPTYRWTHYALNGTSRSVHNTQRIKLGNTGELYFANVQRKDAGNYSCMAFNAILDVAVGGHHVTVSVDADAIDEWRPSIAYSTNEADRRPVAFTWTTFRMECIFGGFPTPAQIWKKSGQTIEQSAKFSFEKFGAVLLIHNVTLADAGRYSCLGENTIGPRIRQFELTVQDRLHFASKDDRPYDQNVTEGSNVTIACRTTGTPMAETVMITINEDIDPALEAMDRVELSSDELIIRNVCKTCTDRETDLMVIQCVANNTVSSVFAQGYINVLERTVIENITLRNSISETGKATLTCIGRSDPLTPVKYTWLRKNNTIQGSVFKQNGGQLFIDLNAAENEPSTFLGEYTCSVTNEYSSDAKSVMLTGIFKQKPHLLPIGGDSVILIIIFVAVLIVILVVALCQWSHVRGRPLSVVTHKWSS